MTCVEVRRVGTARRSWGGAAAVGVAVAASCARTSPPATARAAAQVMTRARRRPAAREIGLTPPGLLRTRARRDRAPLRGRSEGGLLASGAVELALGAASSTFPPRCSAAVVLYED